MNARRRQRTVEALCRFLREYEDIPARETSKRLARHALAVLSHRPSIDHRCRLTLAELMAMPSAE